MTLAVFFSLEAGKRGLFGTVAAAGFFKKISVQCTAEITYGCLDLCSAAKTPSLQTKIIIPEDHDHNNLAFSAE
jgi:hypothetical protein